MNDVIARFIAILLKDAGLEVNPWHPAFARGYSHIPDSLQALLSGQ